MQCVNGSLNMQLEFRASFDANDTNIRGVTWHFFRSAETGRIGAAPEVLQALDRNGIRYIIHE